MPWLNDSIRIELAFDGTAAFRRRDGVLCDRGRRGAGRAPPAPVARWSSTPRTAASRIAVPRVVYLKRYTKGSQPGFQSG